MKNEPFHLKNLTEPNILIFFFCYANRKGYTAMQKSHWSQPCIAKDISAEWLHPDMGAECLKKLPGWWRQHPHTLPYNCEREISWFCAVQSKRCKGKEPFFCSAAVLLNKETRWFQKTQANSNLVWRRRSTANLTKKELQTVLFVIIACFLLFEDQLTLMWSFDLCYCFTVLLLIMTCCNTLCWCTFVFTCHVTHSSLSALFATLYVATNCVIFKHI